MASKDESNVSSFRQWRQRVIRYGAICLALVLSVGWLLYRTAQTEPDFYREALAVSPNLSEEQGDALEVKILELQNAARTKKEWQTTFSDAEINGWLASDLVEKFPRALPGTVSQPRIEILANQFRLAMRFQSGWIKAVVVAEGDLYSTDVPGQIGLQLNSVQAGWLPIPVANIADEITSSLRRSGVSVEWVQANRASVAMMTLPEDWVKLGEATLELDAMQLQDHHLAVSGRSVFKSQ